MVKFLKVVIETTSALILLCLCSLKSIKATYIFVEPIKDLFMMKFLK